MAGTLVAFFSPQGHTAVVAHELAKELNCAEYEIRPKVPYSEPDMDWRDPASRSSVEMKDRICPEMADADCPVADADVIALGFPIWWYVAPTLINTFLKAYDLSGKKIVLFATAGSSPFGETAAELEPLTKAQIIEGRVFYASTPKEEIVKLAKQIALL